MVESQDIGLGQRAMGLFRMGLMSWTCYDVRTLLPGGWQQEIREVALRQARMHVLVPRHSSSRESLVDIGIPVKTVGGVPLAHELPWLRALYETEFLQLAQRTTQERVSTMVDTRFGIVLNVQSETQRYEGHIDTNPIEGLLYCTDQREGGGGEFVISNRGDVPSVEAIEQDCTIIEPKAGYLIFMDGRHHSHYVRPLRRKDDLRVVAAMNYYTESAPESARPADLNRHLIGED